MGRKTNARVGTETSQAAEMDDAAALDVAGTAPGEAADDGEAAGAIAQPPQPAEGALQDGQVPPGGDPGRVAGHTAAEKEDVTDEAETVSGEQDSTAQGQHDPGGELAAQTDAAASVGTGPEAGVGAAADEEPMTAFEKAAFAAAMARYEIEVILEINVGIGTGRYGKSLSLEAARFILAERGAPAESIAIHLALKGLGGSRKPDTLTVLGWAVFKDVFTRVFDHLDAIEKAAAAAAAVAPPAPAWPGERVMKVEPGPLDAAGGMLRR